uniref:Uncharacterized protein n=1 Tax=Ditylenchus dipsaci TaxID=166011 RepID=A0A915CYD5_9BILA
MDGREASGSFLHVFASHVVANAVDSKVDQCESPWPFYFFELYSHDHRVDCQTTNVQIQRHSAKPNPKKQLPGQFSKSKQIQWNCFILMATVHSFPCAYQVSTPPSGITSMQSASLPSSRSHAASLLCNFPQLDSLQMS